MFGDRTPRSVSERYERGTGSMRLTNACIKGEFIFRLRNYFIRGLAKQRIAEASEIETYQCAGPVYRRIDNQCMRVNSTFNILEIHMQGVISRSSESDVLHNIKLEMHNNKPECRIKSRFQENLLEKTVERTIKSRLQENVLEKTVHGRGQIIKWMNSSEMAADPISAGYNLLAITTSTLMMNDGKCWMLNNIRQNKYAVIQGYIFMPG